MIGVTFYYTYLTLWQGFKRLLYVHMTCSNQIINFTYSMKVINTHTHTHSLNKGRESNIKFLKHCYSNGTTHNLDYYILVLHRYID